MLFIHTQMYTLLFFVFIQNKSFIISSHSKGWCEVDCILMWASSVSLQRAKGSHHPASADELPWLHVCLHKHTHGCTDASMYEETPQAPLLLSFYCESIKNFSIKKLFKRDKAEERWKIEYLANFEKAKLTGSSQWFLSLVTSGCKWSYMLKMCLKCCQILQNML